jgi:hypothetical protein
MPKAARPEQGTRRPPRGEVWCVSVGARTARFCSIGRLRVMGRPADGVSHSAGYSGGRGPLAVMPVVGGCDDSNWRATTNTGNLLPVGGHPRRAIRSLAFNTSGCLAAPARKIIWQTPLERHRSHSSNESK